MLLHAPNVLLHTFAYYHILLHIELSMNMSMVDDGWAVFAVSVWRLLHSFEIEISCRCPAD